MRRSRFRAILREQDGIDPDDVILPPAAAAALQEASGGIWAGCVYDEARIVGRLHR